MGRRELAEPGKEVLQAAIALGIRRLGRTVHPLKLLLAILLPPPGVFLEVGEHLPRGTKAWTKAGIEHLAAEARPLHECDLDELWRGRLHLELQQLDVLHQQILATERKLDELARDDAQVKLLETVPGVGTRLAETVANCLDDPHQGPATSINPLRHPCRVTALQRMRRLVA